MESRNILFKETAVVLAGQAICIPIMVLVFGLLDCYDTSVLLGGAAGGLIAAANFFIMALGTSIAANKAARQDVSGGQASIRTSYLLRQTLLFAALILCGRTGRMHPIALVIPLVLVRPILTVAEFFRKEGGLQP